MTDNAQLFAAAASVCLAVGIATKSSSLPAYVGSALGAAFAFSVLELAAGSIPYPILAGPHAAVAAILFAAPAKGMKDTAVAVLGGHLVAMGIALLQVKYLPAQAAFAAKTIVVMLAVGAQKALGAVHPPAVAVAFIWATSGQDDPLKVVGPLIGCAILVVCQQVWLKLTVPTPAGKAKKS